MAQTQPEAWDATLARSRTVAFNAWAGERVQAEFDVTLRHVRLRDTSEAVALVVA